MMAVKLTTVSLLLIVVIFLDMAYGVNNKNKQTSHDKYKPSHIEEEDRMEMHETLYMQGKIMLSNLVHLRKGVMLRPSDVELVLAQYGTQQWKTNICALYTPNLLAPAKTTPIKNNFLKNKKIKILPRFGHNVERKVTYRFVGNHADTNYPMLACPCEIESNVDRVVKYLSKYIGESLEDFNNIPSSNICIYEEGHTEGTIYISQGSIERSFFLFALYKTDRVPTLFDWDGNLIGSGEEAESSNARTTSQITVEDTFIVIAQLLFK